jgi:glutamate carboxypeptidase
VNLEPALTPYLGGRENRMLERLGELVRIESCSTDKAGVDRAGAFLARELERAGMKVERRPQASYGDQLVGRMSWGGEGRGLILGHLDTVWPAGTLEGWPFSVDADGLARGPGVGDMKGGLVVALAAVEALAACGLCRLGELDFLLVPDEELGTPCSRGWIQEEARGADWALVMEPGRENGGVVTSRSVVGKFTVRAEGRSAHCGVDYERGASAVRELARKVPLLESLTRPEEGIIVNVGVFRGGEARQVIPAAAEMLVDFRAPDQAQAERLMARIRSLATTAADPRVQLTAEGVQTRPAFPRSAGTLHLYELASGFAAELGIPLPEVHTRGGSDGSLVAALGVATLDGLGPVSLDDCSLQERVVVSTLVPRALLLANLILALDRERNGERSGR